MANSGAPVWIVGAVALVTAALSGCGSTAATRSSGDGPHAAVLPATASFASATGTWAVVPMGHLGDPLNTFWQLFFRPAGSSTWTARTPPGVATNGGLIATSAASSIAVAFGPSNGLRFSPLAQTADDGVSWTAGVGPSALAHVPDALASAASQLWALGSQPATIWASGANATWHEVVGAAALAASPAGRRCDVVGLSAVALDASGNGFVGADCARPGVVGIFSLHYGSWQLAPVPVPSSRRALPTDVLRLRSIGSELEALMQYGSGTTGTLYAAASSDGGVQWSLSAGWALARSQRVVSTGFGAGGAPLVLLTDGSRRALTAVSSSPGGSWRRLPDPPTATQVVTSGPDGQVDALVVDDTELVDWVLAPDGGWQRRGTVTVPIQFGSSS